MLGDGRLVVGSAEKAIRAYGTQSGKQLMVFQGHRDHVTALVVLVDGRLVSGSKDKTIRVWDTRRGVCLMGFEGTDDVVVGLVGLDDGRFVSRYSWRDHIDLWDTTTRRCSPIMGTHRNPIMSMTRIDDMTVYGSYDGTVRCIWRATNQAEVMRLGSHSNLVFLMVWRGDGILATSTWGGKIHLWA
jgi:WD40 repeat protein